MALLFSEGEKTLELDVEDYEFPEKVPKDESDLDPNWLTLRITWTCGGERSTYFDSCLLAEELKGLAKDLEGVLAGRESGILPDFLEPYLRFSLTQVGELYALQVRFVYDTTGGHWKTVCISQGMDRRALEDLVREVRRLSERFPVRSGE